MMSPYEEQQGVAQQSDTVRCLSGEEEHRHTRLPLVIGGCFAALAIVLTLAGLWREDNLSLRNIALGIVLCGGSWGLVSWAIATAVVQVDEDVASRRHKGG
jgi:hypothetical protein